MLKKIPGNFKNHYKKMQNGLKCDFCVEEMTQNHCISCPGRKESRKDLDMSNLDDLVTYFKTILGENSQRQSWAPVLYCKWVHHEWRVACGRLGCWSTAIVEFRFCYYFYVLTEMTLNTDTDTDTDPIIYNNGNL